MEDEQYDAMFADLLDGFAAETDAGVCYASPRDSSETMSPDTASAGSLEDDEWIKPAQSFHGDMLFGDQRMMVHRYVSGKFWRCAYRSTFRRLLHSFNEVTGLHESW